MVFRILLAMPLHPEKLFAALSHPLRTRVLLLLAQNEELCVCELTRVLAMAQPTISRHLAQLREAGVVTDRREGLWIYYRLHPTLPAWARDVLRDTVKGNQASEPYLSDITTLRSMPNRPGSPRCV